MYLSEKIKRLKTGDEGAAAGDGGSAPLLLGENVGILLQEQGEFQRSVLKLVSVKFQ